MKIFINILIASLFIFNLNAQEFEAQLGVNMSNLSGDDADDTKMSYGLHLGLNVLLPINDIFNIKTGALYSTKGASVSDQEDDYKSEINLSYIEIPMNLLYPFSEQFILQGGPYLGVLTSSKIKITSDGNPTPETDWSDETSGLDFGLNLGGTYNINEEMGISFGYQFGFTSVAVDSDVDIFNRNFHIGFGYNF